MDQVTFFKLLINSLVFSMLGLGVFAAGFAIFDRVTPWHLWKEIVEEKNQALAIVVGAVSIGISLIIASAIHG